MIMETKILVFSAICIAILALVLYEVDEELDEAGAARTSSWKRALVCAYDSSVIVAVLYALAYVSTKMWISSGLCVGWSLPSYGNLIAFC